MNYVALFFAGAFLCNSIPHLVSGLQGTPFPSPFSKPQGVGNSSPVVNVLWGFLNLLVGIVLLAKHPVAVGFNLSFITVIVGAVALGIFSAGHFGKVRNEQSLPRKDAPTPG